MSVPSGFRFAGIRCGIKKSGKPDLAIITCDTDAAGAGVYTQNLIVAAPVTLCRQRTPGPIKAIVVNSGNANACTGKRGDDDACRMTELVAAQLGCQAEQVLVMSTGVIGHHLPMDKIEAGIPQAIADLAGDEAGFLRAADAIMTTDQGRKVQQRSIATPRGQFSIVGMAKGAGMIGPNMATMLGVVATDFPLTVEQADKVLRNAANRSFNCISVEGHTSTNDSLVLLAASTDSPATDEELQQFEAELTAMCIALAKMIPADGEGATHLIEIQIEGAVDNHSAAQIAKTIAASALVKTAITGGDPNWGRIVSAAGYSGQPLMPEQVALTIQGIQVYQDGAPTKFDARTASQAIRDSFDVILRLRVGQGPGTATFWTSDLTVDYVKFNSEYTT